MTERNCELRLDEVTKVFDDDVVIDGVTLRVTGGERVAVVGPSGAGKTTFLRLASGALAPDCGSVLLDDERLSSADVAHAYPGDTLVDRRTALANVLVGSSSDRSWWHGLIEPLAPQNEDEALELLDQVGIADKAEARADTLSAGERQRVAFARALIQGAPVIVADEPTANLDPSARTTVLEVLNDVAGNRMLITVLHDMDLALAHYDRIVGIVDGTIRFDRSSDSVTAAKLKEMVDRDDANTGTTDSAERRPPDQSATSKRVTEHWHATSGHRE